jgi:hypothetical protein
MQAESRLTSFLDDRDDALVNLAKVTFFLSDKFQLNETRFVDGENFIRKWRRNFIRSGLFFRNYP